MSAPLRKPWRARSVVLALLLASLMAHADCPQATSQLEALQSLVQMRHAAQDSLVFVRRSAQDFKNILLRGSDPVLSPMLRQRFERNAQSYAQQLGSLHAQLQALPSEHEGAELLLREREALFTGYRLALQAHDVRHIEQALAADKAVQGADVKTFRALETTIENLNAQTDAAFQDLRTSLETCARIGRDILGVMS